MPLPRDKAWFAAKTYGYGWGFPRRWQGWVVMLTYLTLMMFGAFTLSKPNVNAFIVASVILTAVLLVFCYWKGEPARWRWGDESKITPKDR